MYNIVFEMLNFLANEPLLPKTKVTKQGVSIVWKFLIIISIFISIGSFVYSIEKEGESTNGLDGVDGINGVDGVDGVDGTDALDGIDDATGASGVSG